MTVLMIGMSLSILEKLKYESDYKLIIVEEKEQFIKYQFDPNAYPGILDVYTSNYMNTDEYMPLIYELKSKYKIDGVIPTKDYAVRAAAKIADLLGLRGIGGDKAKILTNKYLLREACEKYNIPHPRYREINSMDEIGEFMEDKPLILKPTRLQASIGISKIVSRDDILNSWERTTSARKKLGTEIELGKENEYVLEEYVDGQEYSVEVLVDNGVIVFMNITEKSIFEESFVEKGHVAPANVPQHLKDKFINEETNLVERIGVMYGMLHSEWKVENEELYLIECAARMPGDYIFDLIQYSYGFNYADSYMKLMAGEKYEINQDNRNVSKITYFESEPGVLDEIEGIENLLEDYVVDWCIFKNIGDEICNVNSSWDRVGYFIVVADNYEKLEKFTNKIVSNVKFITRKGESNEEIEGIY